MGWRVVGAGGGWRRRGGWPIGGGLLAVLVLLGVTFGLSTTRVSASSALGVPSSIPALITRKRREKMSA